ncbi:MAG TPA: hypothetical protein VJ546_11300 [Bacillales bacterium]|nr:hypothetical protein [Bacillales bacterium]
MENERNDHHEITNFQRKTPEKYDNIYHESMLQDLKKDTKKKDQVVTRVYQSNFKPSIPLIITPPKIQDIQLFHNKREKQNKPNEETKKQMHDQTELESNTNDLNKQLQLIAGVLKKDDGILKEKTGLSFSNKKEEALLSNVSHCDGPSIKEESSSQEDESFLNDDLAKKFSALLEESSAIDNKSYSHEESSSNYNESSLFEETSSIADDSSEESSSIDGVLWNNTLPVQSKLVKLPVLLALLNFEIDVFDSFNLEVPISSVTKIDWRLHSFNCQVLLPTPNIFLTGILIADIEYVKDHISNTLHTIKISIPWEKITKVDWIYKPHLPSSNNYEYLFHSNNHNDVQYIHEFSQQFTEKIHSELQRIHFLWHDNLIAKDGKQEIDIQGKVELSINLLQPQYINLTTKKN